MSTRGFIVTENHRAVLLRRSGSVGPPERTPEGLVRLLPNICSLHIILSGFLLT